MAVDPAVKLVVYTAIFGDKDEAPQLQNTEAINLNLVDFICITDNPKLKSEHYKMMVAGSKFSDTTKNARYFKIIGFPDRALYDFAIWHDSSVSLDCSTIQQLISKGEYHGLTTFKHGNNCIYAEAKDCIQKDKDNALRIAFQMFLYAFYYRYPLRNGLFETTICVYNLNLLQKTNLLKIWWKHVHLLSRRDQLSLPVSAWFSKTVIGILPGKGFENEFSTYRGHRYYHYKTKNPLLKINGSFTKKIGLWIIFRIERFLHRKKL